MKDKLLKCRRFSHIHKFILYPLISFSILCFISNKEDSLLKSKSLLSSVLSLHKPFICKETLPYSSHQFNTTFVICIRSPYKDHFLSMWFYINGFATFGGTEGTDKRYEEHLINIWLVLLENYPNAVVADLGSNIGPFTLASRERGHPVISVDPDPENHALLYNSLVLNNFDGESIQVMNSLSDEYVEFRGTDEQGVLVDHSAQDSLIEYSWKNSISSITIFDIFDLAPDHNTFMIKIDIQGYECKALQKFFDMDKKPKYVPYILMEISMHCNDGFESPCKEAFQTKFLPAIEKSGYVPHVPWPITFEELYEKCYFDVLFVLKDAKPFPYWDKYLSEKSFLTNEPNLI